MIHLKIPCIFFYYLRDAVHVIGTSPMVTTMKSTHGSVPFSHTMWLGDIEHLFVIYSIVGVNMRGITVSVYLQ